MWVLQEDAESSSKSNRRSSGFKSHIEKEYPILGPVSVTVASGFTPLHGDKANIRTFINR